MFPIEYEVNVRRGDGEVSRYALLENQDDRFLVVLHPSLVDEMVAYLKRGGTSDDGLIALLVEEATVIDRKKGNPVPLNAASKVLAASKNPALRRAATFREPLPTWTLPLTGEDLSWAFALEVAKRRLSA